MLLALPVRRWLLRGVYLSDDRMPPAPYPVIIRRGVSSAASHATGGAAWFDAIVKVRNDLQTMQTIYHRLLALSRCTATSPAASLAARDGGATCRSCASGGGEPQSGLVA